MNTQNSDLNGVLEDRQFIHQITDRDGLAALTAGGPVTGYIGFDCTAPSLHVGSLVQIMMLRHMQQCGHKPIVLMGGGTTKIGDPSGRDETRQLLDDDGIAANMAGIKKVFSNFLKFGNGPSDAVMVNNADWLDDLEYIPFLREYGSHMSVNRMMGFESVKLRLDRQQNLSFLEFNYMVLQAYDFLELSRRMDCVLQLGGSDQWGNIVSGIDLARRLDSKTLYGLTSPLITTSSGAKMGKTASGAVWLDAGQVTPYDYWQFWRSVDDADVGRFLRLFTDLPLDEIARLESLEGSEVNAAKVILATQATTLCHGADAASAAEGTAQKTFAYGAAADGLPTFHLDNEKLAAGIPAFEVVVASGFAKSNGEARKLIRGGGVRINDVVVGDESQAVTGDDLNSDGQVKLSVGKKRHALGII
ncbi:MAG: tyrosine--tRNA ligase [Alphaproteobacteria bacterium]|jgi:tyrosyl-tRNA synthetase|nr:tyrosine--tRNA ligase [Alphaproteobacteria bacterium]MBT4711829.1 tyrosine--tRNA ligase [Alphaproteobacteria bacterium]MBT5860146.1 tyrosine--tRNA ligase [Alphaproteobacteria bacterium]